MMRAEIWLGGAREPLYLINGVKRVEASMDGFFCRITTEDGWEFETSPHNIVLVTEPEENGGEE